MYCRVTAGDNCHVCVLSALLAAYPSPSLIGRCACVCCLIIIIIITNYMIIGFFLKGTWMEFTTLIIKSNYQCLGQEEVLPARKVK
jgi:hypothetical protein